MKNIAYVFADGNLTHDPQTRTLDGGKILTTFRIAVNHNYGKDSEDKDVSYFEVEAWENLGKHCADWLTKGSKVTIIGSLKQDRWDGADGNPKSKIKIILQQIRFDYTKEKKAA